MGAALFCSVIFTSVERPRKASDEIYWMHHDRLHRSRYSRKSETSGTATKLLWTW
jgi:hypothetical protein